MSSSVKFPDWNIFSEREEVNLGLDVEPGSPAGEMAALLRTYKAERRQIEELLAREHRVWLDALIRQAILVAQLDIVLGRYDEAISQFIEQPQGQLSLLQKSYRSFRILKEQMIAELGKFDLQIEIPLGKTYRDVENVVVVEGWRHHQDYFQEIVVEVREPVVYFKGMPVHQGKVIMGGPLQAEGESSSGHETQPS
jgi:hypothetical protein